MPVIIIYLLISGIFYPKCTVVAGLSACFARPLLYNKMYLDGGPNKRMIGMLLGNAIIIKIG